MQKIVTPPNQQLICIIDELTEELKTYKENRNVSEFIVNKRQKLISQLHELLDNIANLETDNVCIELFNKMNKIKQIDKEIDSLIVIINLKENAKKTAFININNYI